MSDSIVVAWFKSIWLPHAIGQTIHFWKLSKMSGSGMGAALGQYAAKECFKIHLVRSILITLWYSVMTYFIYYLASQ